MELITEAQYHTGSLVPCPHWGWVETEGWWPLAPGRMEGMGFQAPPSLGKDVAMASRQSWKGSYFLAFFLWTWGL